MLREVFLSFYERKMTEKHWKKFRETLGLKSLYSLSSNGAFKGQIKTISVWVSTQRITVYQFTINIISHCFSLSKWTRKQKADSAMDRTVKSCPPRSLIQTDKGLILLKGTGDCQPLLGSCAWRPLVPVDSGLSCKCGCLGDERRADDACLVWPDSGASCSYKLLS